MTKLVAVYPLLVLVLALAYLPYNLCSGGLAPVRHTLYTRFKATNTLLISLTLGQINGRLSITNQHSLGMV